MKILIVILIVFGFGMVGFLFKQKLQIQKELLVEMKNYIEFVKTNIVIFKTNIHEINNKYIITHKNKNANNIKIYLKNSNEIIFNIEKIKQLFIGYDFVGVVVQILNDIGAGDFDFENQKINQALIILNDMILKKDNEINNKGSLYFKLWLWMGAVFAILIWWIWIFLFYLKLAQLEF